MSQKTKRQRRLTVAEQRDDFVRYRCYFILAQTLPILIKPSAERAAFFQLGKSLAPPYHNGPIYHWFNSRWTRQMTSQPSHNRMVRRLLTEGR